MLGLRFPPVPTGIPDEIGFVEVNSHRTACENRADITHLILALVPFETVASRNQRSTSTISGIVNAHVTGSNPSQILKSPSGAYRDIENGPLA